MIKTEKFKKVEVKSVEELREWLIKNHSQADSFWLVTYKKSEGKKYISRWEVLDELLCFGWIDGIRRKLNNRKTMQLISPRKTEYWTQTYKDRAERLIDNGQMHLAGLKSIEIAKSKGLWNFMDDVDSLIIPKDLEESLKEIPDAFEFFNNINDSSKRNTLRWIKLAKTENTRKNRIEKIVKLSVNKEKLPGS